MKIVSDSKNKVNPDLIGVKRTGLRKRPKDEIPFERSLLFRLCAAKDHLLLQVKQEAKEDSSRLHEYILQFWD